jgi:hypothetical protein
MEERIIHSIAHRKSDLDKFQEYLMEEYSQFCSNHNLPDSNANFLTYIIDSNLIQGHALNHFTIRKEYMRLQQDHTYKKTESVRILANRFNLSERTIWNALRKVR